MLTQLTWCFLRKFGVCPLREIPLNCQLAMSSPTYASTSACLMITSDELTIGVVSALTRIVQSDDPWSRRRTSSQQGPRVHLTILAEVVARVRGVCLTRRDARSYSRKGLRKVEALDLLKS